MKIKHGEFNFLVNDVVAPSVRGAKGFCYPNFDTYIRLDEDCLGLSMSWITHRGFRAISIPVEAIAHSSYVSDNDKPYVVVWVSDELLSVRQVVVE